MLRPGFPVRLRGADDDALHAGNLCGRDGHEQAWTAADSGRRAHSSRPSSAERTIWPTSMPSAGESSRRAAAGVRRRRECWPAQGAGRLSALRSVADSQAACISSRLTSSGWSGSRPSKRTAYSRTPSSTALAHLGKDGADGGVDTGGVDRAALLERLEHGSRFWRHPRRMFSGSSSGLLLRCEACG